MTYRVIPALLLAVTAACGGAPDNDDTTDREKTSEGTVFDSMVDSIEDARQVDELSRQQKARMDAAIGEADGRDPPEDR